MLLRIGNPTSGMSIEVDVTNHLGLVSEVVDDACDVLAAAFSAWREWSAENETDDERELRLINEEAQKLQRRAMRKQNEELRKMLDGDD